MFKRLVARLTRRRPPLSDRELADEEAQRRQADEELRRAETRMADQRQQIGGSGGFGL